MRSQRSFGFSLVLVCCVILTLLCGCETWRGLCKDVQKADDWFRENAW